MTNELSKYIDNARIVLSDVPALEQHMYEFDKLISEGMGNQIAKSLV